MPVTNQEMAARERLESVLAKWVNLRFPDVHKEKCWQAGLPLIDLLKPYFWWPKPQLKQRLDSAGITNETVGQAVAQTTHCAFIVGVEFGVNRGGLVALNPTKPNVPAEAMNLLAAGNRPMVNLGALLFNESLESRLVSRGELQAFGQALGKQLNQTSVVCYFIGLEYSIDIGAQPLPSAERNVAQLRTKWANVSASEDAEINIVQLEGRVLRLLNELIEAQVIKRHRGQFSILEQHEGSKLSFV